MQHLLLFTGKSHKTYYFLHNNKMRKRKIGIIFLNRQFQTLIRFLVYYQIKLHAPPLVQISVNAFEFYSCERNPQVEYLKCYPIAPIRRYHTHRLERKLLGYLILFAPYAFIA